MALRSYGYGKNQWRFYAIGVPYASESVYNGFVVQKKTSGASGLM